MRYPVSTLGKALAITVSAATIAALSACGSDKNTAAPSTTATGGASSNGAAADCGGKKLPEPASLALVSGALLGVFGLRRRKNQAAA